MPDAMGVDTERLAANTPEFRALATRIDNAVDSLRNALRAHGAPWGDDASGRAFQQNYGPSSKQIVSGLGDLSEVVSSTADGVETLARGFGRTEDNNIDAAQSIANQVQNHDQAPATHAPSTGPHRG